MQNWIGIFWFVTLQKQFYCRTNADYIAKYLFLVELLDLYRNIY